VHVRVCACAFEFVHPQKFVHFTGLLGLCLLMCLSLYLVLVAQA